MPQQCAGYGRDVNENRPERSAHEAAIDESPVVQLARRMAPGLEVLSVSQPRPRVMRRNVVAVLPSTEEARKAVLMLEGAEPTDGEDSIGLIVMASGPVTANNPSVDPEGTTSGVAKRVAIGAVIGAVVGAALGIGVGSFVDDISLLVAGIVGAVLLSAFGGIWAAFAGLGGSDAYRQTFVEPHARDLSVVSFHTDDDRRADEVFARLSAHGPSRIAMLDETLTETHRSGG